jgi:predicted DNA repair protein MutK
MQLVNALSVLAVLCTGVVYGVDVFFAAIGQRALAQSDDAAIANVMGRLHQVSDARMPIFGVTGLLAAIGVATGYAQKTARYLSKAHSIVTFFT